MTKRKVYWDLFLSTCSISAFTFGGGYVIVPLLKKKFVEELEWIQEEEMLDLVAIAQAAPGVIAVNASLIIGYRVAGIKGASYFYVSFKENRIINLVLRGMQAGVAAVVIDVVYDMAKGIIKEKQYILILLMIIAFFASYFFNVNIMIVLLLCGTVGYSLSIYEGTNRYKKGKL